MRRRRRHALALGMLVIPLAVASCGSGSTTMDVPVGRWGDAHDSGVYVDLSPNGEMRGHDGCNGFGGKWETTEDTITFRDTAMSLMMCNPYEGQWLGGLASALVIQDHLYVLDAEGDQIGVLPRAPEAGR